MNRQIGFEKQRMSLDLDQLLHRVLSEQIAPAEIMNERLREKMNKQNTNRQKNGTGNGRSFLRLGKMAAGIVLCFLLAVTVLANTTQSIALAMQQIPFIGTITQIVSFRTYEDNENSFSAYVEIPEISGLGSVTNELNNQIKAYTDSIIEGYEQDKAASDGQGIYDLDTGYNVLAENEHYYSVNVWTTVSMADTNEYNKCYTIDKEQGRIISLADLFAADYDYKSAVYDEIVRQMQATMAADDSMTYFIGSDGFDSISGEENFYLNESGELVIMFDKYTVAPGFMGVQSFVLGSLEDGRLQIK